MLSSLPVAFLQDERIKRKFGDGLVLANAFLFELLTHGRLKSKLAS